MVNRGNSITIHYHGFTARFRSDNSDWDRPHLCLCEHVTRVS